ncbi:hypothetical protein [Propionibacterium acidifaciens]|uniref:hypothetical protein n=1 Tax=Propionibacterium acidifaciens TaxID=556499 RepID=UPI000F4D6A35|nr:hypothetical protein [Propionibacterium acidifaciens]AYW78490.1 hypothetical protein EGX94_10800 [Propionibacterium acidifaciens]
MPNSPDPPRPHARRLGILLRMREPIAWLVLAVTVVYIVLGWMRLGWNLAHESMGVSASARQTGASVPLIWVLVDVAMVLACVLGTGAIGRARALTRTAAVVVSVVACYDVLILVVGVLGSDAPVFSRVLETIGGLLEVAAKVAATVVLWRLVPSPTVRGAAAEAPGPPVRDAVWAPGQAVGRTWARAGDAAGVTGPGPAPEPGPAVAGASGPGGPRTGADGAESSVPWLTAGQPAAGRRPGPGRGAGSGRWGPLAEQEGPADA